MRLDQKYFDSDKKLSCVRYTLLDPVEFGFEEHIIISEDSVVLFVGQNFSQR